MRVSFIPVLGLVLASILVGCGQPVGPLGPPPTQTTATSEATSAPPPTTIAATPAPGTGLVTGIALLEGEGNEPATEMDLFLAEVTEVVEGQMSLAKLDPASSPKAASYDTGAFVFNDVPPGTYALLAYVSPAYSAVVPNPENGEDLIISVEPDHVEDLGTIYVPKLY